MNKKIFLDIDGVLNSKVYYNSDQFMKDAVGVSDAELMLIRHDLHLDSNALALLDDLIDKSGADVVLSSTWRDKYTPDMITKLFASKGFKHTVTDSTPVLFGKVNSSRIPRGKEIATYLRKLPQWPDAYVILDDHDDMLDMKDHLVLTTKQLGLTPQDVDKALKILNGDLNDTPPT